MARWLSVSRTGEASDEESGRSYGQSSGSGSDSYSEDPRWTTAPLTENPYFGPPVPTLLRFGALAWRRVQVEWWRLPASWFVHAGAAHLFLSLTSLCSLGRRVEDALGHWRMLLVYVFGGLCASLAASLFASNTLSMGATGPVMALLGAAWAVLVQECFEDGCSLSCGNPCRLLVQTVILMGLAGLPLISPFAHLGGLLGGLVLGAALILGRPASSSNGKAVLGRQLSGLALAILAALLASYGAVLVARGADLTQALPSAAGLTCFDTPLWSCCQFTGSQCAVGERPTPGGNGVGYYLWCAADLPPSDLQGMAIGGLGYVAFHVASNASSFGPFWLPPDGCDCLKRCGVRSVW